MRPGAITKTVDTLSDSGIVQWASAGDHSAFELLMRRYNRPLYRIACSILREDAGSLHDWPIRRPTAEHAQIKGRCAWYFLSVPRIGGHRSPRDEDEMKSAR